MKYKIWLFLLWIDNNINHGIVDKIFDLFWNDGKENEFVYWIWKNTSRRFCNWVVDLEESEWMEKK